MANAQRIYETTFIVNASLDDPQVETVIGRIQEVITKNGGTIRALHKWGRKRLSYSINKKTNGFYVNIEFEAPGSVLAQLERTYHLDEMILRHLNVVLDRKAIAARAAAIVAAPPTEAPAAGPPVREPLFSEPADERKS